MSFAHSGVYRGLAALMIFSCHVANQYSIRWLTPLGGVGVAIFLISSGYGLSVSSLSKSEGFLRYWLPKLIRLFVPYLLLELCVYLSLLRRGEEFSFTIFWYINFAIFWYLIYFLINKIDVLKKFQIPLLCFVGTLVLIFGSDLQSEQAFSFLLGVLIAQKKCWCQEIVTNLQYECGLGGVFLILLITKQIPVVRNMEGSVAWSLLQLVIKVSLALLIIGLTYKWQLLLNNYLLNFYGMISFEFYIIHLQFIQLSAKGLHGILDLLILTTVLSVAFYYVGNELSKSTKARFR